MRLRPKGRIATSALVGGVIAGGTVAIIGHASGDEFMAPAELKAGLL